MIQKSEIHEKDVINVLPDGSIKKILSVVDFRKAIPVPNNCIHEINIRNHKDRDLLSK